MIDQMLGKRTARQLTTALKIIIVTLVIIALASLVIAVTSVIAIL
jgi:hypothetical protein